MKNDMEVGVLEMNYSLPNDWVLTSVSSFQDNTVSRQWDGEVVGKCYGLAVAGGRLFASTSRGHIYCFETRP